MLVKVVRVTAFSQKVKIALSNLGPDWCTCDPTVDIIISISCELCRTLPVKP